eukprot:3848334-Amphidinium_carterae.1
MAWNQHMDSVRHRATDCCSAASLSDVTCPSETICTCHLTIWQHHQVRVVRCQNLKQATNRTNLVKT